SGTVPADFTCASQVCHSPEFCCGVKATEGPTIVAPAATRRISRKAVSHIWKYWVLFTPLVQKAEISGSFQMSYANLSPEACSAPTTVSMKVTQFEQLPLSHGNIVLDGWPPSAP